MNSPRRRLWLTVIVLVGVVGGAVWWRTADSAEGADAARATGAAPVVSVDASAEAEPHPVAGGAPRLDPLAAGWQQAKGTEFAGFRSWTERYLVAAPAQRVHLLPEGRQLAQVRRAALHRLIVSDPEAALAAAVPAALRAQLPDEIAAFLEEQVEGEGELALNAVTPLPGTTPATPVFRSALIGRNEYRAHVYGERARQRTVPKTYLRGIAIERDLAVADLAQPLRLGDHDHDHDAGDNQPGTSTVAYRPSQAWTHGAKKVLIIRVDFPDLTGTPAYPSGNVPITDDYAVNLFTAANGVADFFAGNSYGKTSLVITPTTAGDSPDVTAVLRLPQNAATYAQNAQNSLLHADARAAAQAAGVNVDAYDRIGVVFAQLTSLPGSQINYGGLGNVEGKNFWVNGWYDFRVVGHEIGHNYGLMHSNLWKVTDGNPLSATGTSLEYGDEFDLMGGGDTFEFDFSPWNKSLLHWIPDTAVTVAQAASTYRIYRFDHPDANLAQPRALKIVRDSARDYWIGYRRGTTTASLDGGAYVLWGYNNNQQGNLIDVNTPGTNLADAGLLIGGTLNDTVAGIAITPTGQGGAGAEEYLDVQVVFQPRITWSQSTYIAGEQAGAAVLTLKRAYNATGIVSVNYTTVAGTATAPADFTAQSGTITWADGDTADKTITVTLVADATPEGSEMFTVTLSGITGGVIGDAPTATVSVVEPGARDPQFAADFINSTVTRVLPLPDGSVIIGGWFSSLQDANFDAYARGGVARILASGAVDPDFASEGGANANPVVALARQPDGRILVAGNFTTFNGVARNRIVRLMPDGSVDTSFSPGTGANAMVNAVLVQPDGRIVIGGAFTTFNGTAREYLARLNADGSLDTTFVGPDFGNTSGWNVKSLAMQADGQILVAGSFYFSGASFKAGICRVTATGALDATFSGVVEGAHANGAPGTLRTIQRVVVQPDGKILIAGNFSAFNGTPRTGLARLTSTGALETGFAPVTDLPADGSGYCNALLLQPDGKILVGGDFTSIKDPTRVPDDQDVACASIALLSATGVVDAAFAAAGGHDGTVSDLALLPDGRVLLGGDFGSFQGAADAGPLWRFYSSLSGAPGVVQLAVSSASGTEGGNSQITVARTGAGVGSLTVGYATVAGTATAADFTPASGTLTWADGDVADKTITVPLASDAVADGGETFVVNLGQPLLGGALLGSIQQAVVQVDEPVLTGFAAWQATKFSAGELTDANVSGEAADPDGDGVGNLLEYALGLEPKTAESTGLPAVSNDATYWLFTYTRPADRPDLTYSVESSTNLTLWTAVGAGDVSQIGSTATTVTIQARQPLTTANVFFRLRVKRE